MRGPTVLRKEGMDVLPNIHMLSISLSLKDRTRHTGKLVAFGEEHEDLGMEGDFLF